MPSITTAVPNMEIKAEKDSAATLGEVDLEMSNDLTTIKPSEGEIHTEIPIVQNEIGDIVHDEDETTPEPKETQVDEDKLIPESEPEKENLTVHMEDEAKAEPKSEVDQGIDNNITRIEVESNVETELDKTIDGNLTKIDNEPNAEPEPEPEEDHSIDNNLIKLENKAKIEPKPEPEKDVEKKHEIKEEVIEKINMQETQHENEVENIHDETLNEIETGNHRKPKAKYDKNAPLRKESLKFEGKAIFMTVFLLNSIKAVAIYFHYSTTNLN